MYSTDMNKSMEEKSRESDVLPIEKQKIKGKIRHIMAVIPALDERWISDRRFRFYVFPPCSLLNGSNIPGSKDAWLISMSSVLDDIWWLCELQYHKFWSQMLYDKNAMNGIKSFLHLASLQRLYCKTEDVEILIMHKRIKKAVLQFLKRISRSKESELHFMSNEKYGDIMTEYDFMPVSLIFCISTIYDKYQTEYVGELISQLFAYNKGLKFDQTVWRIVQLFGYLKKKLNVSFQELKRNLIYSDDQNDFCDAVNSYRKCLLATTLFLANAAVNISSFLSVYKDGCEFFLNHDFPSHIIRIYKKLLAPVREGIDILFRDSYHHHQTYAWLSSVLDITRVELIKIFDFCLKTTVELRRIAYDVLQQYVKLMKFSLKTTEFLRDLNCVSSVQEITEKIKKNCPGNVDMTEVDQISKSISELLNIEDNEEEDHSKNHSHLVGNKWYSQEDIFEYVKERYDSDGDSASNKNKSFNKDDAVLLNSDFSCSDSDWSDDQDSNSGYESYLTSSAEDEPPDDNSSREFAQFNSTIDFPSTSRTPSDFTISQVELQTAISHVKDLLPHLGDGFIAICLEYYKMDISAVINNILENSLPLSLINTNFCLSAIPFHIYKRVTDLCETVPCDVNQGDENVLKELRKPEYLSYNEMLNDKNGIRSSKAIYERFRNIEDDELYNDDVDEDYEELSVAPLEVATEGVYDKYHDLPIQNPNHKYSLQQEEESSNTSEEENSTPIHADFNTYGNPLDFCENPQDVRARREHHRNVVQQRYNKKLIHHYENSGKTTNERRKGNAESQGHRNDDKLTDVIHYRSNHRAKTFKGIGMNEGCRRGFQFIGMESENHSKNFRHDDRVRNHRIRYENRDVDSHRTNIVQHRYENSCQRNEPKWSQSEFFDQSTNPGEVPGMRNRKFNDYRRPELYDEGSCQNATNNMSRKVHYKQSESKGVYEEQSKVSHEDDAREDIEMNESGSKQQENSFRTNDSTTIKRRQKTVYKSRNANHDRRFLANRKRRY